MLSRLKSLAGQSAIYGLGSLLPNAIAFFLIPLYTRYLSPADYGVLSVTSSVGSVLAIVFVFGMKGAVTRFHYDYLGDESEQRAYYGTIWAFLTLVPLSLALLMNWQGDRLFGSLFKDVSFRPYGQLALWLAVVDVAAVIPLALFRVQERPLVYVAFTVSRFVVTTLAIIYFVAELREGAEGSLKGQLLARTLFAIPFTIIALRNLRPAFHWEKLRASLRFGLPLVPHALSGWALSVSDRILLERFVSLGELGIYSLGYRLGSVLDILLTSVNMAWSPFFYRTATTEDDAPVTFSRLTTYYAILVLMLALGLALGAREVVVLMAQEGFHGAYRVVPVVTLAFVVHGFYFINVNALFLSKETKRLPLFTMLAAIANILLNGLTLPRFGIMAAAWNTVASYVVLALLVYRESRRVYPIPYEYRRLGVLVLTSGAVFLVGRLVTIGNSYLSLIVKLSVVGCLPAALFAFGFFTPRELDGMRRGLKGWQQRVVKARKR